MTNSNQPHPDPLGPVRWLVKQVLHKDRDLAANVRRLRWRRVRPPSGLALQCHMPQLGLDEFEAALAALGGGK